VDQPVQGLAQSTVSQNSVVKTSAWMAVIVLWEQYYKMDAATNWKHARVNTIRFGIKHLQKYQWTVTIGKSRLCFLLLYYRLVVTQPDTYCI
jgi:hypothetical protein